VAEGAGPPTNDSEARSRVGRHRASTDDGRSSGDAPRSPHVPYRTELPTLRHWQQLPRRLAAALATWQQP
jgi:hypothetical protein